MAEAWGDRLTAYLEKKMPESEGWSWNKRSTEIGVTPGSMSNWRKSSPEYPPGELVSKLVDAFDDFDANYLFRDDWPSEIEKPDQDDLDRAVSDFNKIAGGLVNHKKRPVVESKKFRGWTMFVAGRDQLTFDIVVTGRTDRARLIEIREDPSE